MIEIDKIANEHAWKYFELHAQQRITVFNFYIAIIGLLISGVGVSMQQGDKYIYLCSIAGGFMVFISFIFWKLDQRTSMLIKNSEYVLRETENKINNKNYCIFTNDHNNEKLNAGFFSNWSYGKCFRISFTTVGFAGFIITFIPILIN